MERDGRMVSSKVRLVSAEPCHPVQRRDENACENENDFYPRHSPFRDSLCLPFAACIHTTPLPPLTTTVPLRIRKFETFETDRNSPPPSFSRLLLSVSDLVNATNLCASFSREIESLSLSLSPRARARQTDRSEYVRRRKRLNTEPVSIRGISSVYFGIYIRVRRGSLPKPCRTASTRIYTGPVSSLAMPYRFEEA